jgi:hypothetical protein
MSRHRLGAETRRFDVVTEVDGLRQLISRTDAMVTATEDLLEQGIWCNEDGEGADGRRLERLGHLVSAAREAVREAIDAGDWIAVELAKHRKEA